VKYEECPNRIKVNTQGQGGQQCRRKKGHEGKHKYFTPYGYVKTWTDDEGFVR
jgi:hypothetical protein